MQTKYQALSTNYGHKQSSSPPKLTNDKDLEAKKERLREISPETLFREDDSLFQLKFNLDDPAYALNSQILANSRIRALDREKLKSWLMSQTKNEYARETYALASRYLDMYFMKGQSVSKSAFQTLGIACLLLAAKVHQSRIPKISFQVFNKEQILAFEKKLTILFCFNLNPITYITLAEVLAALWDRYLISPHPFSSVSYSKNQHLSIYRFRNIAETLDCLDLTIANLNFSLVNLVATVFYIEHRKFCLESLMVSPQLHSPTLAQTAEDLGFHNIYSRFMEQFFQQIGKQMPMFSTICITDELICFTLQFSRLRPEIAVRNYVNFQYEICKQTYSPQITHLAQRHLQRTVAN